MKLQTNMKRIVLSWDFALAVLSTILAGLLLCRSHVPFGVAREILAVSVSALSIIFSVFFAALAVLITSGDDKFVSFLEEAGLYSQIIWTFKVTLLLLFIALVLSIVLFVTALPTALSNPSASYPGWAMVLFTFVGSYALFAAVSSSMDAIKYAERRAAYFEITASKQR